MAKMYSEIQLDLEIKGYIAALEKAKQANAKMKSDYEKKIAAMNKKSGDLMATFKKMAGVIGVAFSTQQLLQFGKQLFELSATTEGVRNAFERLDDPTLLNDLRAATRGTVTDLKLMSIAVQSKNLGIPIEHLATLFGFAASRARDTGESIDYLINSMALGLGRQSTLRLDNVGLSVKALNDRISETGDFFKGAFSVINEEISKTGEYIETAADGSDRLKASWENLKASFAGTGAIQQAGKEMSRIAMNLAILQDKRLSFKNKMDLWRMPPGSYEQVREVLDHIDAMKNAGDIPDPISQTFVKTIGDLQAELQALESATASMSATDTAAIQSHLKRTQALKDEIKTLLTLREAGLTGPQTTGSLYLQSYTPTTGIQQATDNAWAQVEAAMAVTDQAHRQAEALALINPQLEANLAAYDAQVLKMQELTSMVQGMEGAISSLFRSGMEGWESFGETAKNIMKELMVKLLTLITLYTILNILSGGTFSMSGLGNYISQGFGVTPKVGGGGGPVGMGGGTSVLKGRDIVLSAERSGGVIFKNT